MLGSDRRARRTDRGSAHRLARANSLFAEHHEPVTDELVQLNLQLVSGGTMTVPDDFDSKYGVILFYRGHW